MGKGVGQVLGIVAAIVVPFVAAPIAGAIGLSAAIGETAGATLVGAGLGAASSAATGGNPLLGAAMGGFGGYMANGGWDQIAGAGKNMFGGLFNEGVVPGSVDPLTANFYEPVATTPGITTPTSTALSEYNPSVYADANPNFVSMEPPPPAQTLVDAGNFDYVNYNTGQYAGLDPNSQFSDSGLGRTVTDGNSPFSTSGRVELASAQPTTTVQPSVTTTPYGGVDESGAAIAERAKAAALARGEITPTPTSGNAGGPSYTNQMPVPRGESVPYKGSPDAGLYPGQSYTPADVKEMGSGFKLNDSGGVVASGSKGIFGDMTTKDWLGLAGNAAKLGMTMFNKPPQQLTAAEQAAVQDAQRLASENQALFAKRVEEARAMWSEGTPKPEQAFAQTGLTVERRLMENQRGKSPSQQAAEARRAAIEGTRLGTLAVSEDAARSRAARQTAMNALPTTAPTGAAGLALPIYAALDKRRAEYARDLANASGGLFGGMFGGSSGRYA
jgi:hypothetical protein